MIKKNFWANKNVLITGVNGFVGSNLARDLIKKKSNVIGLTKKRNIESLLYFENLEKKIELIYGDITDKKLLKKIFFKYNIEICFHLAAQVEVGLARKNPFLTWETNIRGTYTLLEVIRENKKNIKSIVIASSDKAYGSYPNKLLPYKEEYALRAEYPYDTSKACADMIAKAYSGKLYKLPIIITRFSNIYGPGQLNFTALIPEAIRACVLNKPFYLRSDGEAIRDFIHINDIVELYKLLSQNLYLKPKKFSGEIFNAGTNIKHKIKDVVKKIFIQAKKEKTLKKIFKDLKKNKTKGEISSQFMDYKKLKKFLNWQPKYKFEKTLPKLIEWYRLYFKR